MLCQATQSLFLRFIVQLYDTWHVFVDDDRLSGTDILISVIAESDYTDLLFRANYPSTLQMLDVDNSVQRFALKTNHVSVGFLTHFRLA